MAIQSKTKNVDTDTYSSSNEKKANRDPITGEPGSHPVATSLGTAAGSVAGIWAAITTGVLTGGIAGPVGAAVGAVAGGILGAGIGHQMGEDIYPTQLAWWEENYSSRPYVKKGTGFDSYRPAYWYGMDAAARNKSADFSSLEPSLRNNWNMNRDPSDLTWDDARPAVEDAYARIRTDSKF